MPRPLFGPDPIYRTLAATAKTGRRRLWVPPGAGDPPPPAFFLSDTFTEVPSSVELSLHTGEFGATWAKLTGHAYDMVIANNRAYPSVDTHYYASGVPPSANYEVSADVYIASGDWYGGVLLSARTASAANTCYRTSFYLNNGSGWYIYLEKLVAGTVTQLQTAIPVGITISTGQTYTLALRTVGTTISCYFNGALLLTATDSAISAAGFAGIGGVGSAIGAAFGPQITTVTGTPL